MKNVDDIEFYKELYMYEISRKEELNSKLPTYIGLITVLGGIVAFAVEHLYKNAKVDPIIQTELILIILITFAKNIFNLYKANHGKTYEYLDNAKAMKKAANEMEEFYKKHYEYYKNENETIDELVERKKGENLINLYIKCCEENAKVNDIRHKETMIFINSFIRSLIIIGAIGIFAIIVKKPEYISMVF